MSDSAHVGLVKLPTESCLVWKWLCVGSDLYGIDNGLSSLQASLTTVFFLSQHCSLLIQ